MLEPSEVDVELVLLALFKVLDEEGKLCRVGLVMLKFDVEGFY